jgi:hypothetical protein
MLSPVIEFTAWRMATAFHPAGRTASWGMETPHISPESSAEGILKRSPDALQSSSAFGDDIASCNLESGISEGTTRAFPWKIYTHCLDKLSKTNLFCYILSAGEKNGKRLFNFK